MMRVARRQQRREARDRAVGNRTGRHHQPDDARRLQFCDQLLEGGRRRRTVLLEGRARGVGGIVADHLVTAAQQTLRHVGAHAAQANHRDLHSIQSVRREWHSV